MDFVVEYKDCCGCGVCHKVCPKNAISMVTDECGYIYAKIDSTLCVDCGKCKGVCPALKNDCEVEFEKRAYAATSLDESTKKSASGGMFALFAKKVLAEGGVVFGTEMNESFDVQVIGIESEEDLPKLQGSKYVQSNMLPALKQIKEALKTRKVLFCSTPCQISALKNYIGKDNENLILVDLVCHGVPNNQMFKGEINLLQKKYKGNLSSYAFRDKDYGHNIIGNLKFKNRDGKKAFYSYSSPYYTAFLKCDIFREGCYNCTYSSINRPGDITICDYWGVQNEEADFYKECCDKNIVGISGVIINTQKGEEFFGKNTEKLLYKESTVEKLQKGNPNLVHPSPKGKDGDLVKTIYKENGWEGVSRFYNKRYRKKRIVRKIYNICPSFVKKLAKKVLGK